MHGLIAFDMISQAEHGADSVAGLITTSEKVAMQVQENLAKIAVSAERSEKIIRVTSQIRLHNSLQQHGRGSRFSESVCC